MSICILLCDDYVCTFTFPRLDVLPHKMNDGKVLRRDAVEFMGAPVRFEPPALQRMLPKEVRSATFQVTYLDQDMRITRGDRDELRVYVRDVSALGASLPVDSDSLTTFSVDN